MYVFWYRRDRFRAFFVSKASPLWLNRQKVYYHKSKTEDAIRGAVRYSDLFVCYSIGIMVFNQLQYTLRVVVGQDAEAFCPTYY